MGDSLPESFFIMEIIMGRSAKSRKDLTDPQPEGDFHCPWIKEAEA
jgi:hypothetical protein